MEVICLICLGLFYFSCLICCLVSVLWNVEDQGVAHLVFSFTVVLPFCYLMLFSFMIHCPSDLIYDLYELTFLIVQVVYHRFF